MASEVIEAFTRRGDAEEKEEEWELHLKTNNPTQSGGEHILNGCWKGLEANLERFWELNSHPKNDVVCVGL